MAVEPIRLMLVTPQPRPGREVEALLARAMETGTIAAVLILDEGGEEATEANARPLVPIVQKAGAAAIVAEHSRVAGRLKADGVHIGSGLADLRTAVDRLRPRQIVGAGNLRTRHAAMEAGEADVDYVFFGRPRGDIRPEPHPKALDFAEWWADLMEVPAVVMAGSSVETLAMAAGTGADFIALNEAVWAHPAGPAVALEAARGLLARKDAAA